LGHGHPSVPGGRPAQKFHQRRRFGGSRIAAPRDVLVFPAKHQLVAVRRRYVDARDIDHLQRQVARPRGREQQRDVPPVISAPQSLAWTEGVIQRAAIGQPEVRRAATRYRGFLELAHAVAGWVFAIARDDG
jgi:hypothetical protein